MNEKIKTLSLFAGIGGIDLGLEATGHFETVQFVEYDPYCQHILKRHWPNVSVWGDVKTFDPDSCGEIDCIVGGYPCQPFSVAGKQKGTQDDRHLWPRMFEIIKHKRPSLILCENVSGHIVLGLDEVLLDLEGEGYSTRAFVIPASAVDANHKRERVWIVAYSNSRGRWGEERFGENDSSRSKKEKQTSNFVKTSKGFRTTDVAYSNNTGDRTSQRRTDKDRQTHDEGQAEQSQSQSSRQSTDVANTKRMGWEQRAEKSKELEREEPSDQSNNSSQGCTKSKPSKNVANTQSFGSDGREHQHDTEENREKGAIGSKVRRESSTENVSNTQGKGLEGQRIDRETSRDKEPREFDAQSGKDREQYQQGSIERRLGGVVDGIPSWLHEPNIPRVTTNQTGRVQRLKMLGNAVVPQVVYQLGLAMKELWDEV